MERSDQSLLLAFITGSEESFEHFVIKHQTELFQCALYITEHPDMAEEAVLQTFFKVYEDADRIIGLDSIRVELFKSLLANIAKGESKEEGFITYKQQMNSIFDALPEVVVYQEFLEAVFKLPVSYRKVFLLRDTFGFSSDEVQEILGISRSNLRRMIYRARLMMRRTLLLLGKSEEKEENEEFVIDPIEIDNSLRVLN